VLQRDAGTGQAIISGWRIPASPRLTACGIPHTRPPICSFGIPSCTGLKLFASLPHVRAPDLHLARIRYRSLDARIGGTLSRLRAAKHGLLSLCPPRPSIPRERHCSWRYSLRSHQDTAPISCAARSHSRSVTSATHAPFAPRNRLAALGVRLAVRPAPSAHPHYGRSTCLVARHSAGPPICSHAGARVASARLRSGASGRAINIASRRESESLHRFSSLLRRSHARATCPARNSVSLEL